MSSQLQNILSALSQASKPQQPAAPQQPGTFASSSSHPSASNAANNPQPTALAGGLSSSLFNLRQLIGRSSTTTTTTRPPLNHNNAGSQAGGGQSNNQLLLCEQPQQPHQDGSAKPQPQQQINVGLAALLRGLPNTALQQPSSRPSTPSSNPPPSAARPVTRIASQQPASQGPPGISQQQQQSNNWPSHQKPPHPSTLHGSIPPKVQQQQQQQHPYPPQFSKQSLPGQPMTSSQYVSPPSVPMAVVLGIVDSPMAQGAWELDEMDLQNLVNAFGPTEWVKVLCSPLGSGRVSDCCIAKFRDPVATRRIEAELDGIQLENIGRVVVNVVPSSMLDGVADEASLAALVSSKVQAKATTPAAPPQGSSQRPAAVQPDDNMEAIAAVLSDALRVGDAKALLATEAGRNAVAAVKADPSLLGAIQSQLQALQTSSTGPAAEVPRSAAGTPSSQIASECAKKRVCRLELVDLFGHHPEFDVATLVVGQDNSNIQYVLEEASQKVDIDLDGVPYNAAPIAERLHLTVTALDEEAYSIAVETLEDLLSSICRQFVEFCMKKNVGPVPSTVGFKRHEYIEDSDGQLVYLGQKERPKPWLEQQQTATTARY